MKHLNQRDWNLLASALADLHADFDPATLGIRTLAATSKLIAADSVAFTGFRASGEYVGLMLEEKPSASPQTLACLGLTRRETEILMLIARGKFDEVIARLCGISPRTVHKHVQNIYVKLGVETRTSAMLKALEII